MTSCVVLFSGGIDSTTALHWALARFKKVFPLTFNYGQRHRLEVEMASRQAKKLGLEHTILQVDMTQIGGSSLTDPALPVPEIDAPDDLPQGPPSTYVPFRNGVFLALAAAWAEARDIYEIVCGFNVVDSPNYPDTRPEFVAAMEEAVRSGTRAAFGEEPIRITAPFLWMKKSDIIRAGLELGADYSHSISCYAGDEIPCGQCPACILRAKAWKDAGARDHLLVRLEREGKR